MATRPTPTVQHARGMLAALAATHTCGEACTGSVTLGDGTIVHLACPYGRLDTQVEADRRIIQGIYAHEARVGLLIDVTG